MVGVVLICSDQIIATLQTTFKEHRTDAWWYPESLLLCSISRPLSTGAGARVSTCVFDTVGKSPGVCLPLGLSACVHQPGLRPPSRQSCAPIHCELLMDRLQVSDFVRISFKPQGDLVLTLKWLILIGQFFLPVVLYLPGLHLSAESSTAMPLQKSRPSYWR